MSYEPFTLFAPVVDPAGVARLLRKRAPGVVFDGPDASWRKAVLKTGRWWSKRTLTITHDPAYYAEPNWSVQMNGMRGYFAQFPAGDPKRRVMDLTGIFRFSLGTLFDPDPVSIDDPRFDILFDLAESLDAAFFTPSSMRDARGRILFGANAAEDDPAAVWPKALATVSATSPATASPRVDLHPAADSDEDEDDAIFPPSVQRVALRALALTALTARAILEEDSAELGETAAAQHHDALCAWIKGAGFADELEPAEMDVVLSPPGKLESRQQIDSAWRLEGLVVLAWALGRLEIPPYDEPVATNELWRSLGLLDVAASKAILAHPVLRSPDEIQVLRNRLFAVHWRLRNFGLDRSAMDFATFARTCWFGPLDIGGLDLVDGDLGIRGDTLDRAPPEILSCALSAAQERHQAANWLGEGPEVYSEASVST